MEKSFIQKKYSKQKQGKWGKTGIDDGGGTFIINELRKIKRQKTAQCYIDQLMCDTG